MVDMERIKANLEGWNVSKIGQAVRAVSPDGKTTATFRFETLTFGKRRRAIVKKEWTCRVEGVPGFDGYGNPAYGLLCDYAKRQHGYALKREEQARLDAEEKARRDREVLESLRGLF